ncbi:MAG TPA: hypothetical protein VFC78_23560 [Tepidisphaeraceae bacterium]|nr:hypothetical protein [Tepidisphaeraceae bacterium]
MSTTPPFVAASAESRKVRKGAESQRQRDVEEGYPLLSAALFFSKKPLVKGTAAPLSSPSIS